MPEKVANIAKNTSYFTLALILQKAISLIYFTWYARALGPADLGKYYFAISLTTIFSIFLDLGLTNLITREVAKDKSVATKYLGGALALKTILSLGTIAVIAGLVGWGHYDPLIADLVWVSAISMLLDSVTTLIFAFSRAFHNLKYESISSVASQAVTLLVSWLVFATHGNLVALMWAQVASSAFAFVYAIITVAGRWHLSLKPTWNWQWLSKLLILAWPFGLFAIANRAYGYFDSLLLFYFKNDLAVGIYQIPFKINLALQFLPAAFVASLYPALSHYWHNQKDQLGKTFQRAISYSLILAMPIGIGIAATAVPLTELFKTSYTQAIWPLRLTAATIFLTFLSYPLGSLLNACDRQKSNTWNMIITAVVNIILECLFIPPWGVMGAVASDIVAAALLVVLSWKVVRELKIIKLRATAGLFGKVLAASTLMGLVVYYLNSRLNLGVNILCGVLVYGLTLFAFKGFAKEDLISVWQSFKK